MRGAADSAASTVEDSLRTTDATWRRRRAFDDRFAPGARIAVGANASRSLVDAVKASGRTPVFAPLDEWCAPVPGDDVQGVVVSLISGQAPPLDASIPVVVDAGEHRTAADVAIDTAALAGVFDGVMTGVGAAAGFDTLVGATVDGVPATGVVVRLPDAADPTTFFAYALGEGTGTEWVALRQPLHPQARHDLTAEELERSSRHLAHLFHLPIGDRFTDGEVEHAVLGVVKAAEYLGWRWWQDPDVVERYSSFLEDEYGEGHEAYRPAFDTGR